MKRPSIAWLQYPPAEGCPPFLLLDIRELKEGLGYFRRTRKTLKTRRARLTFSDGWLSIDCEEAGAKVRASGRWPGCAEVSVRGLRTLSCVPVEVGLVPLVVVGRRLYSIRSESLPCKWTTMETPMRAQSNEADDTGQTDAST